MQHKAATSNFAFIVSLSSKFDLSLQQRDSLCAGLLSFGDAAIALRQGDRLREVGNILSSLPLPETIKAIAQYYNGWTADGTEARKQSLEYAVRFAPPRYQARAILSLAGLARNSGGRHWPQLYAEAIREGKRAEDFYTVIHASKMLAISRAVEDDHNRAIADLEALWPMVRLIAKQDPATYLDVLNSLAVELCEVGKTDEASQAIKIVSASSLYAFNPEWQETAREIEEKQAQPLIIAVPQLKRARAVAVVAVLIIPSVRKVSRPCHKKVTTLFLLTCIPNRASIRAGPRAPPMFIL